MRSCLLLAFLLHLSLASHAEDNISRIRKAVMQNTLAQPGTPPFHLKAVVAPSFERDKDSNRTGTIEIWWSSPTQWKREMIAPGFHLTEILNESRHWQHTEGSYFPEWLREITLALIQPVPVLDEALIRNAETRSILGTTHFSWMEFSENGSTKKAMGAGLALDNREFLSYGSGFGWGFQNKNYASFHNRLIAREVANGGLGPEVTAKIVALEDLSSVSSSSGLFDTTRPDSDSNPLRTTPIDESILRKNLQTTATPTWPSLKDGPLEGALTTEIIVDRDGNVRDIGTLVSDNPGLDESARAYILSLRFQPHLIDGEPVQVLSQITLPFKISRPAGVETFDSARNYFERSRKLTSPAAGAVTTPYILHATFETATQNGVQQGQYTDTWLSASQWCREATLDKSRFARCHNGDRWYLLSQGDHAQILQIVLKAIEPLPTIDTFVESDWRIDRQVVDGASLIRIASGHESADGVLDPQSRGIWIDANGLPIRCHFRGLDVINSQFKDFDGVQVARQVRIFAKGKLALQIHVIQVESPVDLSAAVFTLSGHDWKREFTDESR